MSIGSAHAGEIASPANGAKIGEATISRMYRVAWLANLGRQRAALQPAPAVTHANIRTIANADSPPLDGVAAAKAAVAARMKAIRAQVDAEMRDLAAGQPLRYRLQVDCASKILAAARPPEGPTPAVLTAFGSDVTSVKLSVESCTVKVYWKFLDREDDAPQMRAYSVSVPLAPSAN